jgi:hypothetical protein
MSTMKFPRTMEKGLLAGKSFDTWADYSAALKAAKRDAGIRGSVYKRRNKLPQGTYRLEIKLGDLHLVAEGKVTNDTVIDALLDGISKLPVS